MTNNPYQDKVLDFTRLFLQYENTEAESLPPVDIIQLRIRLILEEFSEFHQAYVAQDRREIADALVDLDYVVLGTCITCGVKSLHNENFNKNRGLCNWNLCCLSNQISHIISAFSLKSVSFQLRNNHNIICELATQLGFNYEKIFNQVHFNNLSKLWTTGQIEESLVIPTGCLDGKTEYRFHNFYAQRRDTQSLWVAKDKQGKVIKPIGFRPVELDIT